MAESQQDEELVDVYRRLDDMGESAIVHSAIPTGATILELGCGTGRMTKKLMELGHHVTAVDSSAQMLSYVPTEAREVHSRIEELDLQELFPVVLLASNLVNTTDTALRNGLLATCRRHVSSDGVVVLQRYQPDLKDWSDSDWYRRGDVEIRIRDFERTDDIFSARIEYRVGSETFAQSFSAQVLNGSALREDLETVGLRWVSTLDSEGTWVVAKPTSAY